MHQLVLLVDRCLGLHRVNSSRQSVLSGQRPQSELVARLVIERLRKIYLTDDFEATRSDLVDQCLLRCYENHELLVLRETYTLDIAHWVRIFVVFGLEVHLRVSLPRGWNGLDHVSLHRVDLTDGQWTDTAAHARNHAVSLLLLLDGFDLLVQKLREAFTWILLHDDLLEGRVGLVSIGLSECQDK